MIEESRVVAYCWEVNADHPCVTGLGKRNSGGGRSELGQRGPWFFTGSVPHTRPWGLTQIWRLANGQEVRAKWKPRSSPLRRPD